MLDLAMARNKNDSPFEQRSDFDRLAFEQGVTAVTDFSTLLGDFWPIDEGADEFIAQLRSWRKEGPLKRKS
jgi:hypothetical protein